MCLQYGIEITNTNMSFAIKTYIIDTKAGRKKTKAGRKKVKGGVVGSEYYCLIISHTIC